MENLQLGQKGPFEATVVFNEAIRKCFYRMGLQFTGPGAEAFAKARPGQFAEFDVSNIALPSPEKIPDELKDAATKQILLRRPFSFARVAKEAGPSPPKTAVEIIYCVLGPATIRLTSLIKGNSINIIGPLGNGFTIPAGKKRALLVAGGMGSPPLEHLAQTLTAELPNIDAIAFAGANSLEVLPFEKPLDKISRELGFWLGEFGKYSIQSFVATDDGSAGFKGLVSDCLVDWLNQNAPNPAETIIYACGPRPMLAKVAQVARDRRIDCQVSMEEMMACGLGLCQSCAIKCVAPAGGGIPIGGVAPAGSGVPAGGRAQNPNQTVYKLCCKDGPVFDSKDLVF